jgi:hypothetical protein
VTKFGRSWRNYFERLEDLEIWLTVGVTGLHGMLSTLSSYAKAFSENENFKTFSMLMERYTCIRHTHKI